ncbi:type II toxin-antitoxin system death-on-curing family toxin [Opitutus sp. GAS368]|uniref:type II toxin-antitoxin system death-on-curing family toxin n=1 Tax=Opitutus sp. GAS368 TaxID=1882749 RepID=UPI0008793A1F|nr:type II toxin-antitoxin system death-on-curing family toxin [Opitutus sp. GAS368]SDR82573.1 death on curing protein [Opitutus sp. GAS368]
MNEPVFLSREKVMQLHRISLEQHGGLDGLREPGLVDSALMQPEATYFYGQGDLAAIAAAYAFHIAQNQPFIDGNKRTAMASALTFLEGNGIDIEKYDDAQLYDAMIGIAEKRLDKAGLAAIFRVHLGS